MPNKVLGTISLQQWLNNQKLHGRASRARTKLLKLLIDKEEELQDYREALLDKYCEKKGKENVMIGKDGKETTDKKKGRVYKLKDKEAFKEKWIDYINEEIDLKVSKETKSQIKDILLETNSEFAGNMANLYNDWCETI